MSTNTNSSIKPRSQIPPYTITRVRTQADLQATITLFTLYAQSLNLDLSFQDFQSEMATMPGKYSPSSGGELFLARSTAPNGSSSTTDEVPSDHPPIPLPAGESLGCVALRSLPTDINGPSPGVCEMKRLYVSPAARGLGLGRALARCVIAAAEQLGYVEMRLDTLSSMTAAQSMYMDLGFGDIEPYCFNPVEGVRFLGLRLEPEVEVEDGRNSLGVRGGEGDQVSEHGRLVTR